MKGRTNVRVGVAAALLGAAAPARAHLVETGFGGFYDGVAHVLLTPADLLVVLALALLAGQRGARAARWTLLAFPAAWFAGAAFGAFVPGDGALPVLTTLTFGVTGALVALNARLPPGAVAALSVAVGLVHGYVNGATMAPGGAGALEVTGAVTAVFCLYTVVAAYVTTVRVAWGRIAVRVAGSWVSAAGILMLGWLARGSV
ncbi:MAG: HupE/UreJ family protein [Burkholderiaceae bacterium]|jgi:urease accessory protein|nr:HupE/UreJ family protein [Burkholderiaceae bacterium]